MRIAIIATLCISSAVSFTVGPTLQHRCRLTNSKSTALNGLRSKFFQIQEMEDKETCETELFFHTDGTIDFFETDGPPSIEASGTWDEIGGGVKIVLKRKYEAGAKETDSTDMGEFQFEVVRVFTGLLSKVGDRLSIQGKIHDKDDLIGDREVGFFEGIDTTEERLGYEERAQK